jgi:hypothetical protein
MTLSDRYNQKVLKILYYPNIEIISFDNNVLAIIITGIYRSNKR